jgi:hypothetical protein
MKLLFTLLASVFGIVFTAYELPKHLAHVHVPHEWAWDEIAWLAFYIAGLCWLLYHILERAERLMKRDMVETSVVAVTLFGMLVMLSTIPLVFWFASDPAAGQHYGWIPLVQLSSGGVLGFGGLKVASYMDFGIKVPRAISTNDDRLKEEARAAYIASLPFREREKFRVRPGGGLARHMVDI